MLDDRIAVELSGPVATVRLVRPEKLNALSVTMYQALAAAFDGLDRQAGLRVIVLASAGGRAFSVGADIAEFETTRGSADAAYRYAGLLHEVVGRIAACRIPVIASIDGLCVGGGLELAVNCDLRIASDRSHFGLPIKRLGLPVDYPELASLRRLVGPAQALAIVLEGRMLDAAEAERIGLVTRIVPAAGLNEAVVLSATSIAEGAPLVAAMHKRMMQRLDDPTPLLDAERHAPYTLFDTADYREGVRAFIEKRAPRFVGA